MRLDRIIRDSGAEVICGSTSIEVGAICSDSRKVSFGCMFVAVKGFASDGHDYISAAIGK